MKVTGETAVSSPRLSVSRCLEELVSEFKQGQMIYRMSALRP